MPYVYAMRIHADTDRGDLDCPDEIRSTISCCLKATRAGFGGLSRGRIELPMAASVFPHEIFCPPKAWAEALWPNLFYWNELDEGGHFAAFEQPKLFTDELRKAFRSRRV